jgi:hypothetical protein
MVSPSTITLAEVTRCSKPIIASHLASWPQHNSGSGWTAEKSGVHLFDHTARSLGKIVIWAYRRRKWDNKYYFGSFYAKKVEKYVSFSNIYAQAL